jgi:predicted PurR-regulated permease PerM
LLLPPLVGDIEDLVRGLPDDVVAIQAWLEQLAVTYPLFPATDVIQGLAEQLRAATHQLTGLLTQALVVVRLALGVLGGALNGIFVLILALYITADSHRILRYLLAFLPENRQIQAERVAEHIGVRLGGWVRGQLTLSAIVGTMTFFGLSLIGVRYAVLLALVMAIGETVPMVGPIVAAVPAVIVAFFGSPFQGFMTLGLYVLVQQLENHLIVPRVMSRAVSLHPLAVLLALLVGSELMGVTGAILSVPVTAALSVIVDEIRQEKIERNERSPDASLA